MFWIALAFAQLPIEAHTCIDLSDLAERPLAVMRQHRIVLCNEVAHRFGVRIDQQRSSALSLCPDLRILERDLQREAGLLEQAALALLRFTPHVTPVRSADGVDGLLLEVQGSLRLFGGVQNLLHAVRYTASELGLQSDIATCPTATGAWLLSRSTQGAEHAQTLDALDRLPVDLLDAAQPHLDTLKGIGIERFGALRALPRAGIVPRFGQGVLDELDRAYGEAADAREWFRAPEQFEQRLELAARVDSAEALIFAGRRLLVLLVGWLSVRHAGITEFALRLDHETQRRPMPTQTLIVRLAEPTHDLEHLTLLLREHLARTTLVAPILDITLEARRHQLLDAPRDDLFPTPGQQSQALVRLVERIGARLGADAVRRIERVADHRPEAAQQFVAVDDRSLSGAPRTAAAPARATAPTPMRPTWLLREPMRLAMRDERPFLESELQLLAGPERIESGWWTGPAVRDYFVAENDSAELLWIYRERLKGGSEGWFLHGHFA
ncbi:DNA polymerase Y family protein [soil metagenome]